MLGVIAVINGELVDISTSQYSLFPVRLTDEGGQIRLTAINCYKNLTVIIFLLTRAGRNLLVNLLTPVGGNKRKTPTRKGESK
jgi:hypothetical protein